MPRIEQLHFAQHFPFSATAKRIVKDAGLSLGEVDDEILRRAEVMVAHASLGKEYVLDINSTELLEQEILAFPVAKILVSLMRDAALYRGLASSVARSTFLYLEKSPDRKQLSLDLAKELSIDFEVVDTPSHFVSVPLNCYLGIAFRDSALKLVNQSVEKGRVFLNVNAFLRFLGETVFQQVLNGLPVETSSVPAKLKAFAQHLSGRLKTSQAMEFNFKVEGKLNANAFPPCIASLYSRMLAGEKLPHMARFFLATFLNSIGMPQKELLELFKKSPDFNEKIASYQIKRIAQQNYAPASCAKIKSYGLCPETDCRVRHPLSYYRRQLRVLRAQKAKK